MVGYRNYQARARAAFIAKGGATPTPTPGSATLDLIQVGAADYSPGLTVQRSGFGAYTVVETAEGMRPSLVGTSRDVYLDPTAGSSANTGDTAGSAKATMNNVTAIATHDTNKVKIVAPQKRILWGSQGWGSTTAAKNMEIEASDGGELIFAKTFAPAAPTITANGDGTYTMSSGIGSTVATHYSPVMDFSPSTRVLNGPTMPPSAFAHTQGTATPASMQAGLAPGQSYRATNLGGTNDTVFRPFGDRAFSSFDGYIIPTCLSSEALLFRLPSTATTGITIWSKKVHWVGGTYGAQNQQASPGLRAKLVATGGGIWAASGNNGVGPQGGTDVFLFDGETGFHYNDALNSHSNASGDTYGRYVRMKVYYTGMGLGISENAGTGHDGPAGTPTPLGILGSRDLYVDCDLAGSYGGTVAYVGSARAILVGCRIGASVRPTGNTYTVGTGEEARVSLVECTLSGVSPGNFELQAASAAAPIKCYGMTQGALRITAGVTFEAMPT